MSPVANPRRSRPSGHIPGGRPLLTLGAQRLVSAEGFRPWPAGFFLDGRREGTGGKRVALRLRLDEGRPLDVERLPCDLDRVLEPSVCLLSFFKAAPQEAIAFRRVGGQAHGGP